MSFSQLGQDLWVLDKLKFKKNGFFVEAGACDGLHLSNTLLLEREFNWNGICCEPNIQYFNMLKNNRNCLKSDKLLYDTNDEEVSFYASGEIGGTLEDFKCEVDRLSQRINSEKYFVKTITLNNLLEQNNAPQIIDYISLDTEGSELRILENFNFNFWDVKIFSIEHNTQVRNDNGDYLNEIKSFLQQKGYLFEENKWDSYFFKRELL